MNDHDTRKIASPIRRVHVVLQRLHTGFGIDHILNDTKTIQLRLLYERGTDTLILIHLHFKRRDGGLNIQFPSLVADCRVVNGIDGIPGIRFCSYREDGTRRYTAIRGNGGSHVHAPVACVIHGDGERFCAGLSSG